MSINYCYYLLSTQTTVIIVFCKNYNNYGRLFCLEVIYENWILHFKDINKIVFGKINNQEAIINLILI